MDRPLETMAAPEPGAPAGVLWPASTERGEGGQLVFGGLSATEIAQQWGTPVYIVDEADMRARARAWVEAGAEAGIDIYYAGKAFLCGEVARWMADEGLNLDTASEGELRTALGAGVPAERIGLHGNSKSDSVLRRALDAGVGRIVLDSLEETHRLADLVAQGGAAANVMIRVTTGVHAGGHDFISTAHEDQKFGLSIASGAAREVAEVVHESPHLNLIGLHSHIGSQIFDLDGFTVAARAVLTLRAELEAAGIDVPEVDLGGGYAIRYTGLDAEAPTPRDVINELVAGVVVENDKLGTQLPKLSVEPGRSIAGPPGVTLYRVETIKDQPIEGGSRRYVSIDGGMADNIRPALYEADYTAAIASREPSDELITCRVVGMHCESGDIVVRDVALPADLQRGDLLAVPATGAYGRSMASNYNMVSRPGVLAVRDGAARWIVRPESFDDLARLDPELTPAD